MNEQTPSRYETENGQRFYTIEELRGRPLVSVTTITGIIDKPGLVGWSARMAVEFIQSEILDQLEQRKITIADLRKADVKNLVQDAKDYHKQLKEEAGDRGTRVHKFIEEFVAATLVGESEDPFGSGLPVVEAGRDIADQVERFIKWWLENDVVPIFQEKTVWSVDGGGYAGTLDAYWRVNGSHYIIDIKTSKGLWPEHEMQLAGYYHAFVERFPKMPVDAVAFLHISELTGFAEFLPRTLDFINGEYRKFFFLAHYVNTCEEIKAAAQAEAKLKKTVKNLYGDKPARKAPATSWGDL